MNTKFYNGEGKRHQTELNLPVINDELKTSPENYRATPELAAAVDTAITLGMPLLLTGEPGSGKSSLAKSIAWEVLGENEVPLQFTVKSETRATDLFYRFDTVGRFHASNLPDGNKDDCAAHQFLHFEAMGKALLQAKPYAFVKKLLNDDKYAEKAHNGTQKRSVVLIDEIDKAPRDVPNDILVEIEQLCFDIAELQTRITLDETEQQYRPIVVITSNSEKALPDAFLRRCVFHHLQFPPFADDENNSGITVEKIIEIRLLSRYQSEPTLITQAISWFKFLREASNIERKPSLAELLNWLEYLLISNPHATELNPDSTLLQSGINNLLLKQPRDQEQCASWLKQWSDAI